MRISDWSSDVCSSDLRKDRPTPDPSLPGRVEEVAVCVALAFPDRVARRRDTSGETWVSVGGRGFRLDPTVSLARHDWLAGAETQGMAAGARILSAAPICAAAVRMRLGVRPEDRRGGQECVATVCCLGGLVT